MAWPFSTAVGTLQGRHRQISSILITRASSSAPCASDFSRRRTEGPDDPRTGQDSEAHSLSLRQLRAKRSEMMESALEVVALRLFDQRGFANVTVEDIALEARISVPNLLPLFRRQGGATAVEDTQQSGVLREALAGRPPDESPLHCSR